jgi:NADH:ubiquinone oxidoreductase subunit 2 (subunit N)
VSSTLLVLPDGLVAVAALVCLLDHRYRLLPRGWLPAAAAVLVLAALVAELVVGGAIVSLLGGGFSQDRFALFGKAALLLTALLVVVVSDWEELGSAALGLTLVACFGGLVVASAADLVGIWAGLQLAVLASLAVVGLRDPAGASRLLPVAGGLAALAAIGMALVAGDAGSEILATLRTGFSQPLALPLAIAVLLVLGALLAELASGPWIGPLAVGAAGLALLKFAGEVSGLGAAWAVLVPALAALAMLLAALGSLSAGHGRRILGWAGLLQLGWVVAGLAGGSRLALGACLFLFGAYLVAAAVGPLALGETPHGLAGLAERSSSRAAGFTVSLLSLAGIPPLAGFFGEFVVASQLVRGGLFWLVAIGFFSSVLVAFAVLRDLRLVFLASPGEAVGPVTRNRFALGGAAAAAVVLMAYTFFANPISGLAVQGAAALGLR